MTDIEAPNNLRDAASSQALSGLERLRAIAPKTNEDGQPLKHRNQGFRGLSRGNSLSLRNNSLQWLFPRAMFSRLAGGSFMGTRDFYGAFGWDYRIETLSVWKMYARGGIARTIAHAYGDTCWSNAPTFTKPVSAGWQDDFEEIVENQNLWPLMSRLDTLCNLGPFAIAIVGVRGSGPLDTPLQPDASRTPDDILYIQPFSNRSSIISRWGTDPTQERFGLPTLYTIYPGLARTEDTLFGANSVGQPMQIPNQGSFKVHWSRVIHYAVGALEQEIFGVPMLWTVWNYLTDLQKVVGGSAESYWMTANRGMQANIDKDMDLDPEDEAALSEELDEYTDGLRRIIRTRGVTMEALGSEVADPEGPYRTLINLISGTTRIPNRILVGSESAHQASTQDKGTWSERQEEYRKLTAIPCFVKPTIRGLMRMGVLRNQPMRKVAKGMLWPSAYQLSPLESAQAANQRGMAAANFSTAVANTPNLMSTEEIRAQIDSTLPPKIPAGDTKPEGPPDGQVKKAGGDGGVAPGGGTEGGSSSTTQTDASGKGGANNPSTKRKATGR